MRTLPFSRSSFNLLACLVLGESPVGRTQAKYRYRFLSAFGESWFGKRACVHCFPKGDTSVLDSERHWIIDCALFSALPMKNPYLFDFLKSFQNNREYAEVDDPGKLLTAIQNDSRLGFSVVSFLLQAIAPREIGWRMLVRGAAFVILLATGAVI